MVLTEKQIAGLIKESVVKVIKEYEYHERQHEPSEEEHAEWIKRKAAAKRRYYDSQKKDDDKPIDHYEYKHGKGDFPVVKEDLFVPFAKEASDDVIRVTPSNFYKIIKSIRNGEFDELLKTAQGGITGEWARNHIDVSAHNMDTASDLYYSVIDVLKERLGDKENTVRLSESQLREVIKGSIAKALNAVGLNETTLDYDMDNFSGRWGRGPRYDILVDGEVYYSDVPDESVDRLCTDLERQGYENIQVEEL